jgi:hypothetical protein
MSIQYFHTGATTSNDNLYRYELVREWESLLHPTAPHDRPGVLWIMLNPSTADGMKDDPTIRRCVDFTDRWGYQSLKVVNLYALRCTRPIHLEHHPDPVGPRNLKHLRAVLQDSEHYPIVVAAWGGHQGPEPAPSQQTIYRSLRQIDCLGFTNDGHPRHPLYVKGDTNLRNYWHPEAAA